MSSQKTLVPAAKRRVAEETSPLTKKTQKRLSKEKTPEKQHTRPEDSFDAEIHRFIEQIESLSKALDPTMTTMAGVLQKSGDSLNKLAFR